MVSLKRGLLSLALAAALLGLGTSVAVRAQGVVSDFNNDGRPDLIFQNASAQQMAVWFMDDTTPLNATYLLPNQMTGWTCAGTADFNQDNKPDLLWQNTSTGELIIWYISGTQSQGAATVTLQQTVGWNVVAIADFNQ